MCGLPRSIYNTRGEGQAKGLPYVVKRANGVCSSCEAAVWMLTEKGLRIRFCNQCFSFRHLSDFVGKAENRLLGSCSRCRERVIHGAKAMKTKQARALTNGQKQA